MIDVEHAVIIDVEATIGRSPRHPWGKSYEPFRPTWIGLRHIAVTEAAVAIDRERRVMGHLVVESEATEPTIGEV